MPNFYSQHGEDIIINEIFKGQNQGFFVEVGCIDGRRFSNTLTLEERGWKGMCIEAHPAYIDLIKKNRPNSIVCHCAAGEKDDDDVTFYANARGSLSTLDRSQELFFKNNYGEFFSGFKEEKVKKRRLDSLFHEHNIQLIDFISLDVEGYELEVLMGLNFKEFHPTVFCIESDSSEHEAQLDALLVVTNGYYKSIRVAQNIFYVADQKIDENIRNRKFEGLLIHTQHPLDKDGDVSGSVKINTRFGMLRRIFSIITRGLK